MTTTDEDGGEPSTSATGLQTQPQDLCPTGRRAELAWALEGVADLPHLDNDDEAGGVFPPPARRSWRAAVARAGVMLACAAVVALLIGVVGLMQRHRLADETVAHPPAPTPTVTAEAPPPPATSTVTIQAAPTTVTAPPPPPATDYDQLFLDNMRAAGIRVNDAPRSLRGAHEVCAWFRQGMTLEQVNDRFSALSGSPGTDPTFVATAHATYPDC